MKDGRYKGAHQVTRRAILSKLKMRGALPSSLMAEELGISSMAVRQHLQELEEAGDVRSSDISRGKGRPAKYWELTESADRHFDDRYRDLILDLFATMKESIGADGIDRLLQARSDRQVEAYSDRVSKTSSLLSQVESLAKIRSEEGYMSDVELGEDGSFYLIENHCPISAAAESCEGLCSSELEVFQKTLGMGVSVNRTEHRMDDSRRCVYRIRCKS